MESSKPSTSSKSLSPSHSDTAPKEKAGKHSVERTQGMTSDSLDETKPLKKMKVSHHIGKQLPLSEERINNVFIKIFADGKIHRLTQDDIAATQQPSWFKSRWVWKAISIFDNAIRNASKNQSLDQLLKKATKKDPYLNLVVKRSILQALEFSEEQSGLNIKSKELIKLWLRYSFASEGFDINNEWLNEWLCDQDCKIVDNTPLFFKFSNTEEHSLFTQETDTEAMPSIGLNKKDLTTDKKPASLKQSLWDLLNDLSYYLRDCHRNKLKPLSEAGSKKHKELYILRDILFRFFSGIGVSKLMQTCEPNYIYDESAWHRLQMEALLDRVAIEYYPDFKEWRSWLQTYCPLP